jgi:hypothetical protein
VNTGRIGVRGQSGVELIFGVSVIILVFLIAVLIAIDKTAESSRVKTLLDAQRIAVSVKDNINMINEEGRGYYAYFSLPEQIQGGYDYDIVIKNNVLEIVWEDNAWTTKLIPSNVTVYCLSKESILKNRVFYGQNGIEITCHRPNLKVLPETLRLYPGLTTVDVKNDAHVNAGPFRSILKTNSTPSSKVVSTTGLGAYESKTLSFDLTSNNFSNIYVDYFDDVNESIESDNEMNASIT